MELTCVPSIVNQLKHCNATTKMTKCNKNVLLKYFEADSKIRSAKRGG